MFYLQIFLLALTSQCVLGLTTGLDPRTDASTSVKGRPPRLLIDRFDQSGLEFHLWVERMIDEGHLLPAAANDSLLVVREDSWSTKLKNVGCNKVVGNRELVHSTQEHFCGFVQKAEKLKAQVMKDEVTNILCPNGSICTLGLQASFNFFNVYQVDKVDDFFKMCNEMFDSLNNACPNTGGVAEASLLKNGKEVEKGKIEATWTQEDGHCTPSKTTECHVHHV
ncbi:hypothetical protein F4820DRAFT_467446 [Hypoxylon rubiginosum]|uniref:Uncharacterized protein n=1 Tax=Hypoxylon rubiginosum TaxID=110542 RepID=A0ACB9YHX2_9PEZI|nr:hypothetical protein F4820DRAFT_467446 [Hypoxylon rubiginosum]